MEQLGNFPTCFGEKAHQEAGGSGIRLRGKLEDSKQVHVFQSPGYPRDGDWTLAAYMVLTWWQVIWPYVVNISCKCLDSFPSLDVQQMQIGSNRFIVRRRLYVVSRVISVLCVRCVCVCCLCVLFCSGLFCCAVLCLLFCVCVDLCVCLCALFQTCRRV